MRGNETNIGTSETSISVFPAFAVIHLPFAALIKAQNRPPRREVNDPGVVATGQRVTPAGVQSVFTGRVAGVGFCRGAGGGLGGPPGGPDRGNWGGPRATAPPRLVRTAGRAGDPPGQPEQRRIRFFFL